SLTSGESIGFCQRLPRSRAGLGRAAQHGTCLHGMHKMNGPATRGLDRGYLQAHLGSWPAHRRRPTMPAGASGRKADREHIMTKVIRCRDVGFDCEKEIRAPTEEEALQQAAEHARTAHGVKEVTPEIVTKVKSAMRDE